jgi:hypothetical protein
MRRLFLLCFVFLLVPSSYAQAERSPLIALSEGAIYALDAETGESEMLVPAPSAYRFMREILYQPITVFSQNWLSPDGQFLAYAMTYPSNPAQEISEDSEFTQRLFLLDLENPRFPMSLNLDASLNYSVKSVAWSQDSALLYVLILGGKREAPQWSLIIIERDNWTQQISIPLDSLAYATGRSIFATENAVVVMDKGLQSPRNQFRLFNQQGEAIQDFIVDWTISPDVNLYLNTPFMPIEIDGETRYGYVHMFGNYLLYQTDFNTGESSEAEFGYPAMLSRNAVDSSLRLFATFYSGDSMGLLIFDSEDNYIGELESLRAFAYPMSGESIGSTFALSPDGQQLAYLQDNQLMLWENGESRSLDFSADIIVWASPIYMPFSPDYFRG